jgi:hypothetical protein
MKNTTLPRGLMMALALTCVPFASAQAGLPAAQPNRLTIVREQVKAGQAARHARHEAGWPAALEKAKIPESYIAITSMTGPAEAWYLSPWDSYAAEGAAMKRDAKDPGFSAEMDRLAAEDAEFVSATSVIQLNARPDLSIGKFPTVAKVRFYEISIFSVRQGQEQKIDEIIKTYGVVRQRVSPNASYRIYTVAAGMPDPTYFVMSTVEDYAELDRTTAEHNKVFEIATAEEHAVFAKWGEAVAKSETNRYRLDPRQSYVSKEVRAGDPDFWMAR